MRNSVTGKILILFIILIQSVLLQNSRAQPGNNELDSTILKITKRKFSVAFSLGIPLFGPSNNLREIMLDYGFDKTKRTPGGWFSEPTSTEHPYSLNLPSGSLEFEYLIRYNIGLGINGGISNPGVTCGFNFFRDLDIGHINYTITPWFKIYILRHLGQIQFGPSFNFCTTFRSDEEAKEFDLDHKETKYKAGFMIGSSLSILEEEKGFVRLFVQYNYIGKIKIGPYYNSDNNMIFLSEKLGFSHLSIGFTCGLKFN